MSELEGALRDGTLPEREPPPIDLAAAQAGLLDVAYATLDSPLGPLLVAMTPRGLVRISYLKDDGVGADGVLADLAARVSPRVLAAARAVDPARRQLDEYFERRRTEFELPIDWSLIHGFARRVLRATARIPFGDVTTYKQVAAAAGSPQGYRAAGNALGTNPIPIVLPCHRVLHSGGGLGGYTGGLGRKRVLLDVEGALDGS